MELLESQNNLIGSILCNKCNKMNFFRNDSLTANGQQNVLSHSKRLDPQRTLDQAFSIFV